MKLFQKSGRTLEMTEMGRTVYRYADEIFSLGGDLLDTVRGRPTGKPIRFAVGIVDSVPKMIAKSLLEPALKMSEPLQLICVEDTLEKLMSELALHNLDLVLSESPLTGAMRIRAFNHQLGESSIGIFGVKGLARQYRANFPLSLDGAPLLLPRGASPLRRAIDTWLDTENLKPVIRAEFDDSALLKVFGQAGEGLFPAPFVVRDEVCRQYEVEVLGEIPAIRERYFAISAERRLKHPAVLAISQSAKSRFDG